MKNYLNFGILILLLIIGSCAKDALWNQDVKVEHARLVGQLTNEDDEKPLKGVKIIIERQTQANGANTFVDTISSDHEGKFEYELPYPNKVRLVVRDTGRYQADTALLEVFEKKDYEVAMRSFPRFGYTSIIGKVSDKLGDAMENLRVSLSVRETVDEDYSLVETLKTNKTGQVKFEEIAFPVYYKIELAENPLAYEQVIIEGKAETKEPINIDMQTYEKFGKGDFSLKAIHYHSQRSVRNEAVMISYKGARDEEYSPFEEVIIDDEGILLMENVEYPVDVKIKATGVGIPFEEVALSLGEDHLQTGMAFEIKDMSPRYIKPVYTNLEVSTLVVDVALVNPTGVTTDSKGNLFIADGTGHRIIRIDRFGKTKVLVDKIEKDPAEQIDGPLNQARVNQPWGIVTDQDDNIYFLDNANVADASHKVRKITFDKNGNGVVSSIAGTGKRGGDNGEGNEATFNRPSGLALDREANLLYVSEWQGNRIRKVNLNTNVVSTVVGNGVGENKEGIGIEAAVFQPAVGIALSPDKRKLYVGANASNSDANSRIGVIDLSNNSYKFFLGDNGNYKAGAPRGMFITADGDLLYTANAVKTVRRVSLNQPVGAAKFETIAGNGTAGMSGGSALSASFGGILGITYDPYTGNWYIADGDSNHGKVIRVMRSIDIN